MGEPDHTPNGHSVSERGVYEAAKVHAAHRGIDLAEWPNQQALVPDEYRWMRDAINAYFDIAEASNERPA